MPPEQGGLCVKKLADFDAEGQRLRKPEILTFSGRLADL
jgi:hypothetical protein